MAIILTKEDIQNARTYMPITMKRVLTRQVAVWCVDEEKGEPGAEAPPLFRENRERRQLFLYGLLARWYLQKDFACGTADLVKDGAVVEQEVDYYMAPADYDEWAGSHVMNQLERLKRDKDIADRIYDLLYDFRALEALSYGAVKDELARKNDLCERLMRCVGQASDPEQMKKTLAEIAELGKELEERKAEARDGE